MAGREQRQQQQQPQPQVASLCVHVSGADAPPAPMHVHLPRLARLSPRPSLPFVVPSRSARYVRVRVGGAGLAARAGEADLGLAARTLFGCRVMAALSAESSRWRAEALQQAREGAGAGLQPLPSQVGASGSGRASSSVGRGMFLCGRAGRGSAREGGLGGHGSRWCGSHPPRALYGVCVLLLARHRLAGVMPCEYSAALQRHCDHPS